MNDWDAPGPGIPERASEQRRCAAVWYRDGSTGLARLWTYFYGIGGDADEMALDAYLHELGDLPPSQMNLLALAIQEMDAEGTAGT
ncbi:hypothetical protein AB0323_06155 [Arthrobacter sp. NPDC080031]|uniref:hypothetical protein n=1 Tax=Arthrobacter sp. NPDC080031 TaxID=3155918 RepID=UPI003450C3C7